MKSFTSFLPLVLLASLVAAIALPEPTWYPIGSNELGTVYSSVAPSDKRDIKERDDNTWYPIGSNELGTVYSSVPPVKRDSTTDVDNYNTWLTETYKTPSSTVETRETEQGLEKRYSFAQAVQCMAICGSNLAAANSGPLDTMYNRVTFCLNSCITQGVMTSVYENAYMVMYGYTEFPPAT